MILFSPAKINLGLQVRKKRKDGFHDITTLMVPVPFYDIIEIVAAPERDIPYSMTSSGIPVPSQVSDNLCYKAWKIYNETSHKVTVNLHLHKQIPPGAGLGGGSSNAATVLKAINNLSGFLKNTNELEQMASSLGSDCALFIENKAKLARGRGDQLENFETDITGHHLVLLNPGIHISTQWAYSQIRPNENRPDLDELIQGPVSTWKDQVCNDFEEIVFTIHPEVSHLKDLLYRSGALYASMSGSGSSVYGIFDHKPSLPQAINGSLLWQGTISPVESQSSNDFSV